MYEFMRGVLTSNRNIPPGRVQNPECSPLVGPGSARLFRLDEVGESLREDAVI
jgi:hypothetical protein